MLSVTAEPVLQVLWSRPETRLCWDVTKLSHGTLIIPRVFGLCVLLFPDIRVKVQETATAGAKLIQNKSECSHSSDPAAV